MMSSALIHIGFLAIAVFVLLNGPLWLAGRFGVLSWGPKAPRWLTLTTIRASRVTGIVLLLLWLTDTSQGNIFHAFLLGAILMAATFLLLNGPLWLATRGTFARGPKVPVRLIGIRWFSRILGAGTVVGLLYLVFRLQLLSD